MQALWKIKPPAAKKCLFVIDALDECGKQGDTERNEFLEVLKRMKTVADVPTAEEQQQQRDQHQQEAPVALPTWVRIFTTGRPEQDIWDALKTLRCAMLETRRNENIQDVRKYIEARLLQIVQFEVSSEIIEAISKKSDGVFVYARALMENLSETEDMETASDLERIVENLSGNVDSLYLTSLRRCVGEDSRTVKAFRIIMKIILASRQPLTEDQIAKLLDWRRGAVGMTLLQVCVCNPRSI